MYSVGHCSPDSRGRPRNAGVVVLAGFLLVLIVLAPPVLGLLTALAALVLACSVFGTFVRLVNRANELARTRDRTGAASHGPSGDLSTRPALD